VPRPELVRVEHEGVVFWTDEVLATQGIRVAFSERSGGVSSPPFGSLNLAAHVGDDQSLVDENRSRFMSAVGLADLRDRLITADQVHGVTLGTVDTGDAGRGARATESMIPGASSPVPATDGLVTTASNLPLMLFFADCVPVVLAVTDPVRGIAIVHAGWRGALERIPEKGVEALLAATGARASQVRAYVGPHIGGCCYKVSTTLVARFNSSFDKIAAVDDRLDLASAVKSSLRSAGLAEAQIAELGSCTYDSVDRFFSYRASNVTGRHGALAVITKE
jgi:YfiH family protein